MSKEQSDPGLERPDFDYQPRTRVLFGEGCLCRLGALARETGARKALLVTDPGIVAAGHAGRARAVLAEAGLEVTLFDRVKENPTTLEVEACLDAARAAHIEMLVGLGGGSSMDTAKGCNLLLTNGGRMRDYWGQGKAHKPMKPLICVPTTAGTGSECQSFALIADEKTHQKMACGDPKAAARVALLDPALSVTQPRRVTAVTATDALAHALESAVTRRRNALSWLYARAAFRLGHEALPRVLEAPKDLRARGRMLLAAAHAGTAIENSMLGAAHAAANPLTARFGLVHGLAVGVMLPHVVRFNGQDAAAREIYAELAREAGLVERGADPGQAVTALAERLEALLALAGLPRSLAECGVKSAVIPEMAGEAAGQWTARFNPRPVRVRDFVSLYEAALGGEH